MNYKDIKEYYGKTVVIYHSIGIPMFDTPVRILPKEEQGNNWRFHLRLSDGAKEYSTWISSIGKIEEVA